MMIVFICCKAYKEKQAGFDFFLNLYADESVVKIIEAKGSPSVSCV